MRRLLRSLAVTMIVSTVLTSTGLLAPDRRVAAPAQKEAFTKAVVVKEAMMTGRWRPALTNPATRKMIQDSLLVAVKSHVSPEQAGLYQAEVAKRISDQKLAVVDNMVVKLDHALMLSADQREKIAHALASH